MYRYFVTKRSPVSLWMLDDEAPFQEHSGLGSVADMLSGVPSKSVPLVTGAGYSSVFKQGAVGRFACNFFQRGQENRAFALESWILPIHKGDDVAYGSDFLLPNPAYTGSATGWTNTTGTVTSEVHDDVMGETKTVLKSTTKDSAQTRTSYLDVDPSKGYRIRIKLKDTVDIDSPYQIYIGLTSVDAAGASSPLYPIDRNSGSAAAPSSNFYFWFSNNPTINEWFDAEFYVYPANTAQADRIGHGYVSPLGGGPQGSNVMLDTTVDRILLRWLNWGNDGTTYRDVFVTDVEVVEIEKTATNTWEPVAPASHSPQQILSHHHRHDGLTVNDRVVRFATSYVNTGSAACEYDLGELKLAHVVGKHNADQNELWVNGELVSTVTITEEQKADTYISTTPYLYSGDTTSSQQVAMNGVAFYSTLSGDDIVRNYEAGIDFIGQDRVYPQFGGTQFDLSNANGSVFIEELWANKPDFERGVKYNVELAPDQIEPSYANGVSVAGTWTTAIALDSQADTSIYGVMVAWSGYNAVVEVSLDGAVWTPAVNGELVSIIPNGYNPSDKDLQIRVSFPAGLTDGWLESLNVIGFRNNVIENISARPLTLTYPAVVRKDYEPNLYRDDNGIHLHGATLTIGTDTTPVPEVARVLEVWVKPVSGSVTINVAGTKYRNGVADTSLPVGEWSLLHIVASADITSAITITGNAIIGQATLYPTALSAADIDFIWKSYVGRTAFQVVETVTTTVTESASPVLIYAHDWAIDSAG